MSQRLMIASPCYGGKNDTCFTLSLMYTSIHMYNQRESLQCILHPSGSLLAYERNLIFSKFMESDATHILCIDSDMGWEYDAPVKLLKYDKDIVGGLYPMRSYDEGYKYPFHPVGTDVKTDGRLIEVQALPFGFVMISKKALLVMQDFYEELKYSMDDGEGYGFCTLENIGGKFFGEDYTFSYRARKAGLKIWCDPDLNLTHLGKTGNFLKVLRNDHNLVGDGHEVFSTN